MDVFETNIFTRSAKKLHRNQIAALDQAVSNIQSNPTIGELKTGDLVGVRVYKFHMLNQLKLLAYVYDEQKHAVTMLDLAAHENFYQNLKRQLKSN